jgi:hypothetical protein
MNWLTVDFFERDVLDVAYDLIGVEFVWHGCSGIIVETEAYCQSEPACHGHRHIPFLAVGQVGVGLLQSRRAVAGLKAQGVGTLAEGG